MMTVLILVNPAYADEPVPVGAEEVPLDMDRATNELAGIQAQIARLRSEIEKIEKREADGAIGPEMNKKIESFQNEINMIKGRLASGEAADEEQRDAVSNLERDIKALQEGQRDVIEHLTASVPQIGLASAYGMSLRERVMTDNANGRVVASPGYLAFAGLGAEIRIGGRSAGRVYGGLSGVGLVEAQDSVGFKAYLSVGALVAETKGVGVELGGLFGFEEHFIEGGWDPEPGPLARTGGLALGPHVGTLFANQTVKVGLDLPFIIGRLETATTASTGLWVEASPCLTATVFFTGNYKEKERAAHVEPAQ